MIPCRHSNRNTPNSKLTPSRTEQKKATVPGAPAEERETDPRPKTIAECLAHFSQKEQNLSGVLLLIGGADLLHFRLRVAQSHVRVDTLPSYWSQVAIVREYSGSRELWEVALDPNDGFRGMPKSNGVRKVPINLYDNVTRFPNVAVVRFPVKNDGVRKDADLAGGVHEALTRIQKERGIFDFGTLILPWLAFAWSAGTPTNPLLTGQGIPSAVFAEAVFARLGVELTPGLDTRSSCPEAIWQAVKWWPDYYKEPSPSDEAKTTPESKPSEAPYGEYWLNQPNATVSYEEVLEKGLREKEPPTAAIPSRQRKKRSHQQK